MGQPSLTVGLPPRLRPSPNLPRPAQTRAPPATRGPRRCDHQRLELDRAPRVCGYVCSPWKTRSQTQSVQFFAFTQGRHKPFMISIIINFQTRPRHSALHNKPEPSEISRFILLQFDRPERFLNRPDVNESQTVELARDAAAFRQFDASPAGAVDESFDRVDMRGINATQISAFAAQPQS